MCTINAKFLEKPIPEMVGYKVFRINEYGKLTSPVFSGPEWERGKIFERDTSSFQIYPVPERGFHFFASWMAANAYRSRRFNEAIVKVKAYNVFAKGKSTAGWLPYRVFITEKMELLS